MAGKSTQNPRPLQRKRRRSTDSNHDSNQHPLHVGQHDETELDAIPSSSPQDSRPKPKKPRTRATRKSMDKKDQFDANHNGSHEEATGEPSETSKKHVHFSESQNTRTTAVASTSLTPSISQTPLSPFSTQETTVSYDYDRVSLTPTLPGSAVSVQELNFSPLRTIIDERMRRRLRRSHLSEEVNSIEYEKHQERKESRQVTQDLSKAKEQIKELQLQLELQSQLGIDVSSEAGENRHAMEEELKKLKQEMQDMQDQTRNLDLESVGLDYDDEAATFIDPDDIPVSPSHGKGLQPGNNSLITAAERGVTEASTQTALDDTTWENERQAFEQALIDLNRKLGDAQSLLQILTIELSNLGFSDGVETPGADIVISSIRNAFHQTRSELEYLLPDMVSNATSNRHLLILVEENVRSLLDSQNKSEAKVQHQKDMEELLKVQCNDLLDKLADMDIRKQIIETQWQELDVNNEQKEKRIVELDDLVAGLQNAVNERDTLLQQKDDHIAPLEHEVQVQSRDLEKLRRALESYRDEVKKLESLITRLEKEHGAQIATTRLEHEAQISGLNQDVEVQKQYLSTAEAEIHTKMSMITALELRLEEEGSRVDSLKAELGDAVQEANSQQSQREAVEENLSTKATVVNAFREQVADLESDLEETKTQLESMEQSFDTEHRQRETTEAALDDANTKIIQLEGDIHCQGIQANELRQKIFELQIAKEKITKELTDEVTQVEQGLKHDLANETERRKNADQLLANQQNEIDRLQSDLKNTERDMASALEEKDNIIQGQANELSNLSSKLDATTSRLDTITTDLENLKNVNRREVSSLHADLHNAHQDMNAFANNIQLLTQEAHEATFIHTRELSTRDEQIAALSHELELAQTAGAALEADKASLERRVEAEAEAMLHAENTAANQITNLRDELQERKADIEAWKRKCESLQVDLDTVVEKKDTEIGWLRVCVQEREEELSVLRADRKDLKGRLMRAVRNSERAMAQVQDGVDAARARAEQEAEALAEFGRSVLEDIDTEGEDLDARESIAEVEFEKDEAEVHLPALPNGIKGTPAVQKLRRSSRKTMRDSGIGMASDPLSSP